MHFTREGESKQHAILQRIYFFGLLLMTRYFAATIGVVVLASFLVGFFTLVRPEYFTIRYALSTSVENLDTEVQELKKYERYMETVIKSYKRISSGQLEKVARIVPPKLENADLFFIFDAFAEAEGMRITNISIAGDEIDAQEGVRAAIENTVLQEDPVSDNLSVQQKQISLTLVPERTKEGISYEQFKQFLADVEQHTPLLNMPIITFTPGQQELQLTLHTYTME